MNEPHFTLIFIAMCNANILQLLFTIHHQSCVPCSLYFIVDCSSDKRSLVTILRSAGASTTPTSPVTITPDIKHDPMFSHPPPWATVEKIYAVITKKTERPDSSAFSVKKFDFKMFSSSEDKNTKSPKQTQKHQQHPPTSSSVSFHQQNKPTTSNSLTQNNHEDGHFNEAITVKEKNDAENSIKYTSSVSVRATDPWKLKATNQCEETQSSEPIYDVPKTCDTIEVIEEINNSNDEGDKAGRKMRKENNIFLQRLKSTSAKLQKESREKSLVLRNKICSALSRRRDNEEKDGNNISLYTRIVETAKQSVKHRSQESRVEHFNFSKLQESIKDVRVKLTRTREDKQEKKPAKEPKLLKITKANKEEIYTAAPVNTDIDFKGFKTKIMNFSIKMPQKKSTGAAGPGVNNTFRSWKTKISQNKIKLPSFKLNDETNEDKRTSGEVKTNRFSLARFTKQGRSDETENNDKKSYFGKFKIREKWSEIRQECSKSDNKLKSLTSSAATDSQEKQTRFSNSFNNSRSSSRLNNYNSQPKPFDSRYNGVRDTHQYKWNFVDGQWRKSGTVGL